VEKGLQSSTSFHLAGVIPVAGQSLDFEFPWHDCLQPIGRDYLAIERAVLECAYAGCETIWIVCHDEMQPLIKHRLGDFVKDPCASHGNETEVEFNFEHREIPIFYTPVHPKDRDKRDCLGWSVIYGAMVSYWNSRLISKWVIPDRWYVAFPYGVYEPSVVRPYRKKISSKKGFYLSFQNKTIRDGEYLGFTFDSDSFKKFRKIVRQGTGHKAPGQDYLSTDVLPLEERWSARFFSLAKIFEPAIIEDAMIVNIPWFYNIDNWQGLCNFLGSSEQKSLESLTSDLKCGKFRYKGIATEKE